MESFNCKCNYDLAFLKVRVSYSWVFFLLYLSKKKDFSSSMPSNTQIFQNHDLSSRSVRLRRDEPLKLRSFWFVPLYDSELATLAIRSWALILVWSDYSQLAHCIICEVLFLYYWIGCSFTIGSSPPMAKEHVGCILNVIP